MSCACAVTARMASHAFRASYLPQRRAVSHSLRETLRAMTRITMPPAIGMEAVRPLILRVCLLAGF